MTDITSPPAAGGAEPGGDVLVDTGEHHHLAGVERIRDDDLDGTIGQPRTRDGRHGKAGQPAGGRCAALHPDW